MDFYYHNMITYYVESVTRVNMNTRYVKALMNYWLFKIFSDTFISSILKFSCLYSGTQQKKNVTFFVVMKVTLQKLFNLNLRYFLS